MTDRPTEIPPWSALAERARDLGDHQAAAILVDWDPLHEPDQEPIVEPTVDPIVEPAAEPSRARADELPPEQSGRADEPSPPHEDLPGRTDRREDQPLPLLVAPTTSGTRPLPRWLSLLATTAVAAVVAALVTGIMTRDVVPSGPADRDVVQRPAPTVRDPSPPTSPDHPAEPGTRISIGNGWTVMVHGWDPDATAELAPLNPAGSVVEGQVMVLLDVEMTYQAGDRPADSVFYGVDLAVVTADGTVVTPADTPCVATDPKLDPYERIELGVTRRGNICFVVDTDQVEHLQMTAAPSMAPQGDTSWFALS